MENTKPNKKLYIVVEVILFAVYILIGVLLFVTENVVVKLFCNTCG